MRPYQESIHQILEGIPSMSSGYLDMFSAATSTTARSSESLPVPQSPWDNDMLASDPKLTALYENPYDYLHSSPVSAQFGGGLSAADLDAIMSTGILDNNVPVSDTFLPPQPVVQSPAQYPYSYPELQPPVYQEALPSKIVLPTLPQIMLSSSETQTDSVVAPASSLSDRRVANRYSLNDFVFQHTLGTGSFGRVHLGPYPRSNSRITASLTAVSQSKANTIDASTPSKS
jgi:hypothetical protein